MAYTEDTSGAYDWGQSPPLANWAAINEDGSGWWFANPPNQDQYRGRWVLPFSNSRSWPMYSVTRLSLTWRDSLLYRPGFDPTAPPPTPTPAPNPNCPQPGDVIVTDVIGYIEAGLGNIPLVPPGCLCN